MNESFNVTIRSQNGLATLDLSGEINAFAGQELNAAFAEALATGQRASPVALNFTQVTYINSTGIALIVGLMSRARQVGRTLAVYGLSNHYMEIFHITRLSDFMSIYTDEASLLAGASH
jgi:anti-anti-sigma factor